MQAIVSGALFRKQVERYTRFIPSKSTTPASTMVQITAVDGRLDMMGSDAAMEVRSQISANVQTPGQVAVAAHDLARVLKVISSENLTLKIKDQKLNIVAGRSDYKIPVSDVTIPSIPLQEAKDFLELPKETLIQAIQGVLFAIAKDDNRYGLNGGYWDTSNQKSISLVGTDGNRLSLTTLSDLEAKCTLAPNTLFPRRLLEFLLSALEGDTVKISILNRAAKIECGSTVIVARLLEAAFPTYKEVLPKTHKLQIKIKATTLTEAIRRVAVVGEGTIRLDIRDGGVVLTARKLDFGDAREEVDCETTGSMTLGVNGTFLTDALRTFGDGELDIKFGDTLSPIILSSASSPNFHVVMPVRLD